MRREGCFLIAARVEVNRKFFFHFFKIKFNCKQYLRTTMSNNQKQNHRSQQNLTLLEYPGNKQTNRLKLSL